MLSDEWAKEYIYMQVPSPEKKTREETWNWRALLIWSIYFVILISGDVPGSLPHRSFIRYATVVAAGFLFTCSIPPGEEAGRVQVFISSILFF